MDLRVLVVESNPEHLLFLKDVLEELDGSPHWISWTHVIGLYASTWAEAQRLLSEAPAHVVLLNPTLDDSKGAATFRKCQALAPQSAVVLVLDEDGLPLADQLLREGVQDYLLRGEIDCAPLARALRNAVDRHRLAAAIQSVAMVDTLTGLLSHSAFLLLAERDLRLAQRWGRRAAIVVAEPVPPDRMGEDLDRDMRLVKAAERLRTLAGSEDLVGRIGRDRLAIAIMDPGSSWAGRSTPETRRHLRLGAEAFDPSAPEEIQELLDRAAENLEPAVAAAP